jgi:lysophospholipid acyltransferase (LPLAT)-like uncharacterized protein
MAGWRKSRKKLLRWLTRTVLLGVISLLLRLIYFTLRKVRINRGNIVPLYQRDQRIIFAFWHCDMLMILLMGQKERAQKNIFILTSLSEDGELLARALQLFHYGVVRGSTSRGAVRSLVQLKQVLDDGFNVGIAMDGPRGPRFEAKLGALQLARKTGAYVLPCAIRLRPRITLNSWDRSEVPLPFGRAEGIYGKPIKVPRNATNEEMEQLRQQIQDWLVKVRGTTQRGSSR